ncbi:hypothetical protein Mapa_014888 [Marchantia paleacea]|nr:hypothetical protein Mapa_014888 [Marchantia paleacea]
MKCCNKVQNIKRLWAHIGVEIDRVEKLNTLNYRRWSRNMEEILKLYGYWRYCSSPPENIEESFADEVFEHNHLVTLRLLKDTLNNANLEMVEDIPYAWDIWSKLKAVSKIGLFADARLRWAEMSTLKLDDDDHDVIGHMAKLHSCFTRIGESGLIIPPHFRVAHLFASLSPKYEPIILSLDSLPDEQVSWDYAYNKIVTFATRFDRASKEVALLVDKRKKWGQKSGTQGKSKETRSCYSCGERGHLSFQCKKVSTKSIDSSKANQRPEKHKRVVKKKERANLVEELFSDDEESDFSNMSVERKSEKVRYPGWYLDSACSSHMSYESHLFESMKKVLRYVESGNGDESPILGVGTVPVTFVGGENKDKRHTLILEKVRYVPDFVRNLMSVSKLTTAGFDVHFWGGRESCTIEKNGQVVCNGVADGNLFRLLEVKYKKSEKSYLSDEKSLELWHKRLGHLSESNMRLLQQMVGGLTLPKGSLAFCGACAQGKSHKASFPKKSLHRSEELLDLIHSDVCGKIPHKSLLGAQYYVTFIDDKSRKSFLYLLKSKDNVLEKFKVFVTMVETQTGKKVRRLRSDGGLEYNNKEFNGVAERLNRTLQEKALSMLQHAQLEMQFWGAAIKVANYLRNRSPTAALNNMTPEEAWSGKKPDLTMLRVFGCPAYAHIPKEQRIKLGLKSKKLIFIGYEEGLKGYLLYNPRTNHTIRSRDVLFDEESTWRNRDEISITPTVDISSVSIPVSLPLTSAGDNRDGASSQAHNGTQEIPDPEGGEEVVPEVDLGKEVDGLPDAQLEPFPMKVYIRRTGKHGNAQVSKADDSLQEQEIAPRRSIRQKFQVQRLGIASDTANVSLQNDIVMEESISASVDDEPSSYAEAARRSDWKKWEQAILEEKESLQQTCTWEFVDLPPGRKTIGCRWVFKVKRGAAGEILKYKARLVAKGYSQQPDVDYHETFAPVARYGSIRMLLALAAENNWEIDRATRCEDSFLEWRPRGRNLHGCTRWLLHLQWESLLAQESSVWSEASS